MHAELVKIATGVRRVSDTRLTPVGLIGVLLIGTVLAGQSPPNSPRQTAATAMPAADPTTDPFWLGITDAASFTKRADAHLAHAQTTLDALIAVAGRRTVDNTLRPYDDISIEIGLAEAGASIVSRLHRDPAMQNAAKAVLARVAAFQAVLSVNPAVYQALSAVDASSADAETRHYLTRELRTFRMAGVDKDAGTRARLQQLRQQIAALGETFRKNIDDGVKTFKTPKGTLEGLPPDFIAAHPPDSAGLVTLTSRNGDAIPILTYARSDELRKQMYVALNTVAYPANDPVLKQLLIARGEVARLAGYPTWAEYDIATRMAGSAAAASDFIDRVVEAARPKSARELEQLLERKRQDVPGATVINPWESSYYSELVRRARYDFDSQRMRPYLAFARVKPGLLEIASVLFGVTFRPAKNAPVWHPSVEALELVENGRVLGRFYLDLHPRPGKSGNSTFASTLRKGVGGRQTPEIALVAVLPGGQPGDPGLMTHDEVRILFHEFGHVVQNILNGGRPWIGTSGSPTERDFNEGPSQMFEEWTMDAAVLARFARHYETNEPLPSELVAQMRRASAFGQALNARSQMMFARLSLSLYDRDPQSIDPQSIAKDIQSRYVPYPFLDGTHFESRFTQIVNDTYSSSYYTYMWSLVIAKDLFSQFDQKNLLDSGVARRYRETILVPGASKTAGELVEDFLGRPFNFKAWEAWLNSDI